MTEEQYWDRDCNLVRYYRQADELKTERINTQAWLQGKYIYDAVAGLAPILQAFAKKGTKARPYVDAPYPINKRAAVDVKSKKEKAKQQKGKQYMEALMVSINNKFGKGSE